MSPIIEQEIKIYKEETPLCTEQWCLEGWFWFLSTWHISNKGGCCSSVGRAISDHVFPGQINNYTRMVIIAGIFLFSHVDDYLTDICIFITWIKRNKTDSFALYCILLTVSKYRIAVLLHAWALSSHMTRAASSTGALPVHIPFRSPSLAATSFQEPVLFIEKLYTFNNIFGLHVKPN